MTAADVEKFVPRKDYLKAEYGFSCECERCKLEAALPDSEEEDEDDDDEDEDLDALVRNRPKIPSDRPTGVAQLV